MVESKLQTPVEHDEALVRYATARLRKIRFLEHLHANFGQYFKAEDYLNPAVRPHFDGALNGKLASQAWLAKYRGLPLDIMTTIVDNNNVLARNVVYALAELSTISALAQRIYNDTGRRVRSDDIVEWMANGCPEWAKSSISALAEMKTSEV